MTAEPVAPVPAGGTPPVHPGVWVTQAFVPVLRATLNHRGGIPHAVRTTVLEQLDHRSPAQLRERIERRWWQRYSHRSAQEIAQRADDIALALVAPPQCTDPRCEDGWRLDADQGCPRCQQRHVDADILAPDGPPAKPEFVAATSASIRQMMLLARTRVHHQQSRLDERRFRP